MTIDNTSKGRIVRCLLLTVGGNPTFIFKGERMGLSFDIIMKPVEFDVVMDRKGKYIVDD